MIMKDKQFSSLNVLTQENWGRKNALNAAIRLTEENGHGGYESGNDGAVDEMSEKGNTPCAETRKMKSSILENKFHI
jgi:hypothetical protein